MASVMNFNVQAVVLFCLLKFLSTISTVSQGNCFPGWHEIDRSCFKIDSFYRNASKDKDQEYAVLNSARVKCLETGSDLAIPHSPSLLEKLRKIIGTHPKPHLLGAHDSFRLDLKWSSGARVNPAIWGRGKPNITFGNCVTASFSPDLCGWRLKTTKCDSLRGFICKTLTAKSSCAAGFSHIDGHCYKIYHRARSNWTDASKNCSRGGYRLATVNTSAQHHRLSDLLGNLTLDLEKREFYLDRVSTDLDSWTWMDGSRIDPNLWKSGYPKLNQTKTCVHLDGDEAAISNLPCDGYDPVGVICQNQNVNEGFRTAAKASIETHQQHSAFSTSNSNLASCFSSNEEFNPWINIPLPGDLHIYKIKVNESHFHTSSELYQVQVLTHNWAVCCHRNEKRAGLVFDCVPPVKGLAVQVRKKGSYKLTVCELYTSGLDSKSDGNGVMRELWNISNLDIYDLNEIDEETVSGWHVIKSLNAPSDLGFGYGQKLTTYLQINQSGNFTFYMTCAERCELWLVTVNDLNPNADLDKNILVQLNEPTQDWHSRPIDQSSGVRFLSECYFYRMEVFMTSNFSRHDHLAVGVKFPNGTEQKPMSGNNLYWLKPGETTLEIQLSDPSENATVEVGSSLSVAGSYKYCCRGVFCPSCKLDLGLHLLNKTFPLNSSLSMTCKEISFQVETEVAVNPGVYVVLANYSLVEHGRKLSPMHKPLANVTVQAAVLQNCTSPSNFCKWNTSAIKGSKWNGGVFSIGGKKIWLQSTLLPWKEAYSKVPTCLQFKYNTSSSNSSFFYLKVSVVQPNGKKFPKWSIKDEQGNKSTFAQVSWKSEQNITIQFKGKTGTRGRMTIYDVIIKTLECELQPMNATLGGTLCNDKLRQVKFCNKCFNAEKLCDGTEDCSDGSDELKHCNSSENKQFQCVDGSFIPWSETCRDSNGCQDKTHKPSICESSSCPLNNLSCGHQKPQQAVEKQSHETRNHSEKNPGCYFERTNMTKCGWKGDEEWRLSWNSSKKICSHDRFRAKNHGNFVCFIGGKNDFPATISTNVIGPSNNWKCMRFWYYICNWRKTSSLSYKIEVLVVHLNPNKTETSEELLSVSDNTSDHWIFVQLPLTLDKYRDVRAKISFRGTVSSSGNVLFAIDDVSFSPEKCEKIPFTDKQSCKNCVKLENWTSTPGDATWRLVSSSEVKRLLENLQDNVTESSQRVLRFDAICQSMHVKKWLQKDLTKGTLCVWIRTKFPGLQLEYRQNTGECRGKTSLQLVFQSALLKIRLHEKEWNISTSIIDDKWHHVCASWGEVQMSGVLQIYIDGQIKLKEPHVHVENPVTGRGDLYLRFKEETTSSGINGYISGLNVWNHVLESQEIWRMSLGCANETGNAEAWTRFQSYLSYNSTQCSVIRIKKALSCQDREGDRIILNASRGRAELKSPWFIRSDGGHGKCIKFRFMFFGHGNHSLHLIQSVNEDLEPTPIWAINGTEEDYKQKLWQYGQVSITGTVRHRLIFRGQINSKDDGYIAVGGLYIVPGYCEIQPPNANQGFRKEILKNQTTGWILSPQYPGYYTNDASYTWTLIAPPGHVIKLEFVFFDLENSSDCSRDFVEVNESHVTYERFCGQTIPAVIESKGRIMFLLFESNEEVIGGGFKANYTAIKVPNVCLENGCPENCNCCKTTDNLDLVVQCSGRLTEFPGIPNYTTVMLLSHNNISELYMSARDLHCPPAAKQRLVYIDLSYNKIVYVEDRVFQDMSSLLELRLNGNFIKDICADTLSGLSALQTLDLGDNLLSKLDDNPFGHLTNLLILSLRSNRIKTIDELSFRNTRKLTHLYLQKNIITHIKDGLFQALSSLKVLYLNDNKLKTLTPLAFDGLRKLEILHLQNNPLDERIPQDVFEKVKNLKILKIDKFILCCYAKKAIKNLDCQSNDQNEFSSCDDMMKYPLIRACLWVLGILATFGNLIVLIWRALVPDNNRVQSLLLSNLAMADFLMGVYLLTLTALDSKWKGEYFMHDVSWRNSPSCRIVGAISMLSSEVSVAMLTITTADRLICVVFALKFERMTLKSAYVVCLCVWVVGVVLSIIPILDIEYFLGNSNGMSFFSQSAVCLPLQLSSEKPSGWEYFMAIFIIFNFCSFFFILVAYMAIYWIIMKLVGGSASAHMQQESARANRLFIIVLTDFLCWMPVIIMGIMSLTNASYFSNLTGMVYVWVAVFVLPLNSSVNPILYTLATSKVKEKLGSVFSKFSIRNKQGRVHPSLDMASMPSDRNYANTIDWSISSDLTSPPMTIVEVPLILQEESSDKIGYVVCREEDPQTNEPTLFLVKWFSQDKVQEWEREVSIHIKMSQTGNHPCVLPYLWHLKAEGCRLTRSHGDLPSLPPQTWLICFQFVSNITLGAFMRDESAAILEAKLLCRLATDVLQALRFIYQCGICHNNINIDSILIQKDTGRFPSFRAVLCGFGCASHHNPVTLPDDMVQFAQLLRVMTDRCAELQDTVEEIEEIVKIWSNSEHSKNKILTKLEALCK